jgi:hypothetical protein
MDQIPVTLGSFVGGFMLTELTTCWPKQASLDAAADYTVVLAN